MLHFFPTEVWSHARKPRSVYRYFSYQRIGAVTAIFDFTLIVAASIATGVVYHFLAFDQWGDVDAYVVIGCYSGLTFVLLSKVLGLYQLNGLLYAGAQIRGILAAWGATALFMTSLLFLLKTGADYSRGATISFDFLGVVLIVAFRYVTALNLRRALANGTLGGQRVIVIGDPEELAIKPKTDLLRTYGAREVGRFELSPASGPTLSNIARDSEVIDSGIIAARANYAELVLLALRWVDTVRTDFICERLRALPLPVFLLPDRSVISILSRSSWDRRVLAPIEVQRAPLSARDLIVKRLFDVMFAGLALAIFSPLLLLTAVAIKLDSDGPVIFRQRRRGFNGREFAIYKFRTMTVLEDGSTVRQAQRDDARVTWLGRLLRASSIDELPQLINVLTGDMSLVGPRPHAVVHDDEYGKLIDNYMYRHHVKPGITGWAQIHGFRGETDVALMEKRIQLDLWYINNWSLWLDLKIMARTCVEVLRGQNAY
jgi:undecaprenyl-phosphate galactose phosphotransferase/putative colanic acid biosynthesis UDP-glucose lipid carrier transferase